MSRIKHKARDTVETREIGNVVDGGVDLAVIRCGNCHRPFFDADVAYHAGCPFCGAKRLVGSGRLTSEEEESLRKRALHGYEEYRNHQSFCVGQRILRSRDPREYDGPGGVAVIRLERPTSSWTGWKGGAGTKPGNISWNSKEMEAGT